MLTFELHELKSFVLLKINFKKPSAVGFWQLKNIQQLQSEIHSLQDDHLVLDTWMHSWTFPTVSYMMTFWEFLLRYLYL